MATELNIPKVGDHYPNPTDPGVIQKIVKVGEPAIYDIYVSGPGFTYVSQSVDYGYLLTPTFQDYAASQQPSGFTRAAGLVSIDGVVFSIYGELFAYQAGHPTALAAWASHFVEHNGDWNQPLAELVTLRQWQYFASRSLWMDAAYIRAVQDKAIPDTLTQYREWSEFWQMGSAQRATRPETATFRRYLALVGFQTETWLEQPVLVSTPASDPDLGPGVSARQVYELMEGDGLGMPGPADGAGGPGSSQPECLGCGTTGPAAGGATLTPPAGSSSGLAAQATFQPVSQLMPESAADTAKPCGIKCILILLAVLAGGYYIGKKG